MWWSSTSWSRATLTTSPALHTATPRTHPDSRHRDTRVRTQSSPAQPLSSDQVGTSHPDSLGKHLPPVTTRWPPDSGGLRAHPKTPVCATTEPASPTRPTGARMNHRPEHPRATDPPPGINPRLKAPSQRPDRTNIGLTTKDPPQQEETTRAGSSAHEGGTRGTGAWEPELRDDAEGTLTQPLPEPRGPARC